MNQVVRIAKHHIESEFGSPDPFYKKIKVTSPTGEVQVQKLKRGIPEGISAHDAKVLKAVRTRAYRLDMLFSFLGFNLGYTAIVSFLPVIGPFINVYLALKTVQLATTVDRGLTNWVFARMLGNVAIDFLLTFVPIIGSTFNAIYKCNARNAVELDHMLRRRHFNPKAS